MRPVLHLVLLALCGGCATAIESGAMTPTTLAMATRSLGSVRIEVSGGRQTNPFWMPEIEDDEFADAVAAALRGARLFDTFDAGAQSDFVLKAHLMSVAYPKGGIENRSSVVAEWRLVERATGRCVFFDQTAGRATTTLSDAIVGDTRFRLAMSLAAAECIRRAVERMEVARLPATRTS